MNPKTQKRIRQRFQTLRKNPATFLARFDLNGDGLLDTQELEAAFATITADVIRDSEKIKQLREGPIRVGTRLHERYDIISEIGNGSQSHVFIARDLRNNNAFVIVKQMRLALLDAWDALDSFQRESEFLARLSHPRVPNFIDKFTLEEQNNERAIFAIQGFLPGHNLEQHIEMGHFFNEEKLQFIAEEILNILTYLHSQDPAILHRDIKPSNILYDEATDRVYLIDFGAVQFADKSKTMAMGTMGYMPNEQLMGNAMPQSDLYGLGVTLIHLATRTPPTDLEVDDMRYQWRDLASLSEPFANWIDMLAAPNYSARFRSARVALKLLKNPELVSFNRKKRFTRALELEEYTDGKPEGSKLKLWESVDQFVCTFEAVGKRRLSFGEVVERFFARMSYKNHTRLEEQGGGFSLNGEAFVQVAFEKNGTLVLLDKRQAKRIKKTWFIEGYYGLEGIYVNFGNNENSKTESFIMLTGLDEENFDWVWNRLQLFCTSHRLDVLRVEKKPQSYI